MRDLQAQLGKEYRLELLTFGETLAAASDVDRLAATARRSDLSGAIADLAERHSPAERVGRRDRVVGRRRYRRHMKPIRAARSTRRCSPLASAVPSAPRDREIVNLTAGEPLLPGASIDVSVSATSHGFGKEPVELRVSANGRPIEVRRVTPSADGAPIHAVFTVSPEPDVPTVYTVQIPEAAGEVAIENNSRSVLVPPQTGKRRLLVDRRRAGLRAHVPQARACPTIPASRSMPSCARARMTMGGIRFMCRRIRRAWRRCRAAIRSSARSCSPTTA